MEVDITEFRVYAQKPPWTLRPTYLEGMEGEREKERGSPVDSDSQLYYTTNELLPFALLGLVDRWSIPGQPVN
jgi:hypothetical protein